MPSIRIKKDSNEGVYFLTLTVSRLYYLFDRYNRWEILLDSLRYCQSNKCLKIYNWVFMLNHIHLIVESRDLGGFVRYFKTFTSKKLKRNILDTEPGVLKLFKEEGRLWGRTNMPELIESESFYLQKANYIEQNPVKKNYVKRAEDWVYSSANDEGLLKLESIA